jgi:hypothetical protein
MARDKRSLKVAVYRALTDIQLDKGGGYATIF